MRYGFLLLFIMVLLCFGMPAYCDMPRFADMQALSEEKLRAQVQQQPGTLALRDTANGNTLLHAAVIANQPERCTTLLQLGIPVDVVNELGQTPLHLAIDANRPAVASLLLDAGASPFIGDARNALPRDYAMFFNRPQLQELLTRYEQQWMTAMSATALPAHATALESVDLRRVTCGRETAQAAQNVRKQPLRVAKMVFARGVGTFAPSNCILATDGQWARFRAVVGLDDAVARERKASVVFNVIVNGRLRWQSAVMQPGMYSVVDTDIADAYVLELRVTDAGNGNDADMADWAGACLLPIDARNPPPLRALLSHDDSFAARYQDDIFRAARDCDVPTIRAMLQANPKLAKATDSDFHATPLHWAMLRDLPAATNLLLAAGADPNARNTMGQTPLHIAAGVGAGEQVQALLRAGAQTDISDGTFFTARDYAMQLGFPEIARMIETAPPVVIAKHEPSPLPVKKETPAPPPPAPVTERVPTQVADPTDMLLPPDGDFVPNVPSVPIVPEPPVKWPTRMETMSTAEKSAAIVAVAKEHITTKKNLRYRFGGSEENGTLDCSGFVRGVLGQALDLYGMGGSAYIRISSCMIDIPFKERSPGDILVRVDNPATRAYEGHVMIYVGNNEVIDMCSTVGHISRHPMKEADLREYCVRRVQ